MLRTLAIIIATFLTIEASAKPKATGLAQVEAGQSFPQNELTDLFSPGNAMRLRLFGGAKIKLGAVGIGWDISYAEYELKNELEGHYNRVLWDWLFIPINIGFLQITPGLAWVITDVQIDDLGLKEQSIRPASVLSIGASLGVISNFAITAQVRGEAVWEDMEPVSMQNQDELNITGKYITATIGGMLHF